MIEVTLFGWLFATLASALSVALLVIALSAAAFLGFTLLSALRAARARRLFMGLSAAVSALVFIASLAGVRAGGLLETVALSAALAAAVGTWVGCLAACLAVWGWRGLGALSAARGQRAASLRAANSERARALEEGRRRFLEGGDLRAEVAEAEASLERLRAAIRSLEGVRADLTAKLASVEPAGPDVAVAAVAADYIRLRDEVALKIDLGLRILAAAEAAAFRLACFEPIRRLLRRRPQEATLGLSRASTAAELEERIDRGTDDIKAFLGEVAGARATLDALEARRPPGPAPSMMAAEDAGPGSAPALPDALDRARAEIDAVESAYRAVLDRTHVIRLRLATRAGMEQVASAAGALSDSARTMGLDESELRLLLEEVARAESAMTISAPDGADLRSLTDALARSADALDRNDTASLDELLKAMREMD